MRKRLRHAPIKGNGFFKTGSLKNVRSIAGYIKARDGQTYVVSIIQNDKQARYKGRAAQDKFLQWVFEGREHMITAKR